MQCDTCAIKNLVYQYADYIDRGELDAVASLFAHGRILASSGDGEVNEVAGSGAIATMYRSFTRLYEDNGTPHTQHVTTNVIVDLDADGPGAGARSYAVVFQAVDDFPLQPIVGVRYHDRFLKCEGEWRFSERRIEMHLFGDLSRHLLQSV